MVSDLSGLPILRGLKAHFTPSSFRKPFQHQGMGRQREDPCQAPGGVPRPDASPPVARRGLWPAASRARSEAADPLAAGQVAAGPGGSNVRRGMFIYLLIFIYLVEVETHVSRVGDGQKVSQPSTAFSSAPSPGRGEGPCYSSTGKPHTSLGQQIKVTRDLSWWLRRWGHL